MRYIKITQGYTAVVDDEDYDMLIQSKWQYASGYAKRSNAYGIRYMHRLLMDCPKDKQVDHINGDGLDNRKKNLRICSAEQNQKHMPAYLGRNKTGFKGVSQVGKRYNAHIRINGKHKYLGTYSTKEEAARAYDAVAIEAFGEFAWPNFKPGTNRKNY
jgi:hypothetical protein